MEEEIIYTWLLVNKDGTWNNTWWSKAKEKPPCGEPDKLEWIEWNKPLPEDIDSVQYKYENGELIKE